VLLIKIHCMKKYFIPAIIFLLAFGYSRSQNVAIGTTTPNASAKLEIISTNSGLLPPRMTTAQRYSIVNPVPGLMILIPPRSLLKFIQSMAGGP
jgi:hypothetical protein